MMKSIMKTYLPIVAIAAAAMLTAACDKDVFDINSDPFKGQTYQTQTAEPISTMLQSDENFSEYVKMLDYADFFSALNQAGGSKVLTAFVPTNEALQEFYKKRGVDGMEGLGKDYVRSFIMYHTVARTDTLTSDKFIQLHNSTSPMRNLTNDPIKVEIDAENAGQALLNGEARVIEMDRRAYNGSIYVISSVMTPLVETVIDRVKEAGGSDIMLAAIDAAGWTKALSTIADTTYNDRKQRLINNYAFTLLNVSDATFAKEGIGSLAQLQAKLKANDSRSLTEDSLLREYVGYHILTSANTMAQMGEMTGSDPTKTWSTAAKDQVFTVTFQSGDEGADSYLFNMWEGVAAARFIPTASDIMAKNGYVHNLDQWMPILEPEQTTVVWDLGDYPEVRTVVPQEYYQPAEPTSNEQQYSLENVSCFTYQMGASGSANRNYRDIAYVTCKSTLPGALYNDRVVFNIGYMGKVSMNTPALVKGKYKVELSFVYLSSHNFMRTKTQGSNGGMIKLYFDENDAEAIYPTPYTGVTGMGIIVPQGVYTATLYDEIEFTETRSHTMTFTVLDPSASKSGNFSLEFDCITFTPIK